MPITIPSLQKITENFAQGQYLYKDLWLDLEVSTNYNKTLEEQISTNDIRVSYDIEAIKNSIKNIFNTRPGQRFLFPLFGLDMYQYLFSVISENNAQLIGEKIIRTLETFEPRIYVKNCLVTLSPDQNAYFIDLNIDVPDLREGFGIYSALDLKKQSFIFFENSRNR